MPRLSEEETPFLPQPHDDVETPSSISKGASIYFATPLKVLTAIFSIASIVAFGFLIVSLVGVKTGPFQYTYRTVPALRDLTIVVIVAAFLSIPTIFISFPILFNLVLNITFSIVVLVFSTKIFTEGWPDSMFCNRWKTWPDQGVLPPTEECLAARERLQIWVGISGTLGLIVGTLMLIALMLRLIALYRSKFWEKVSLSKYGWSPKGFTVQFTLAILPAQPTPPREEERLI